MQQKRLALIDADSIVYIVAWHHKDSDEFFVAQAVDSIVNEILKKTEATHYLGSFTADTYFRYEVYKYADYKGHRGEKPEWVGKWEVFIKNHLMTHWGFVMPVNCEADDVLSGYPHVMKEEMEVVYCSPDKDLRQLPGIHFDYKKMDSVLEVVTKESAMYNLCMQLLMGDSTDNIKGIPGMGEVKAKKLLSECIDHMDMYSKVIEQYLKSFGDYYGPIIFEETSQTVTLLNPNHPQWNPNLLSGFVPREVVDIDLDLPEL